MNGHLDANLSALRERCPDFLAWWEKCTSLPGEYNLLSSLSGLPDLEIVRPGGQRIILYNRENPFETIQKELADQSFPKGSLTFLFGLGLGYRALHILSVMQPGHAVYIVERDPDILRLALALHDYSGEIRSGKITFAVPEEEELRRLVQGKSGAILTGQMRLFLEDFTRRLDSRTTLLHDSSVRQTNAIRINFNTISQVSGKIIQNELANLPKALLGWNVEGLLNGAFRNRPAIIVATGPSLQRNISLLRDAKGKALIIAVGQALRILLAYDVYPDILCSVDFSEYNHLEVKDSFAVVDTPLLINPSVYPQIPLEYRGDLFITLDRNNLLSWTGINSAASLGNGLTVAQMALNLALMAGTDPIIFTGQDLAFGETSHIEGVLAQCRVSIQGKRVVMENEQGASEYEAAWVPGYFGGRVLSTPVLLAFLEIIETTVRDYPDRRFINATEGGAHIAGTERMALRDALNAFCMHAFPVAEHLDQAHWPLGANPRRLCRMIETSKKHMHLLLRHAGKLERMTEEMKSLFSDERTKGSPSLLHQLQSLNQQALKSFSTILQSLEEDKLSSLATLKAKQMLVRMDEQSEESGDTGESAHRTILYCEELCKGLREACPPLLERIDRIQPVLEEYAILTQDLESVPPDGDEEYNLRLGRCLRRMGHWKAAVETLERAASVEACRDTALEELFALHLDRNRFETAGQCLQRLSTGHLNRNAFQNLLVVKQKQERERLLEQARHCLDLGDFAGCLLACRTMSAQCGNLPEFQQMTKRALEIREEKVLEVRKQLRREWEKRALRDEGERRLRIAREKMREKDYSAALSLFYERIEWDQHNEEAGMGIVLACEGLQDWQGAEAELCHLAEQHPEKAIYFQKLGNVQLQQEKTAEAMGSFNKAVELNTDRNTICLQIAATISGSGKTAEALVFFERHLKENPNDYRALVLWGDAFLKLRIGAAAKLSYETAIRIRPGYDPAVERLKRLQPAVNS